VQWAAHSPTLTVVRHSPSLALRLQRQRPYAYPLQSLSTRLDIETLDRTCTAAGPDSGTTRHALQHTTGPPQPLKEHLRHTQNATAEPRPRAGDQETLRPPDRSLVLPAASPRAPDC